ncbi:hypothetical protein [Nubsella zeaxanthinifaciens]|uniref:hypothetical protein n=1 Tax=Nubsella zeaxanthinifaciens TaxID=392412 RepID=UPI000DE337D1|nr:hypothetical protein [Nubsella zeaxanthinifaciens]
MSIKRPDEYEHANPNEPIVRSSNVKGGALKTADLATLLTDFVGLESKLIEGVTKVYVESDDADYRLKNIAAVNLLASWSKVVTGAGGGASSFSELEGAPSDNEALGADLTRIEDKADGAQADVDALTLVVDGKLNTADYNQHFRGRFTSLISLQTNVFSPALRAGDYAQVDVGSGSPVKNYNWDADDEEWIIGGVGSGATNTDQLPEGSTNLYYTSERVASAVNTEKKNYIKECYVLSVMEIIFPMELAGQFTALSCSTAMSNLQYKIGAAGTYTTFSTPVSYSAGAEIYLKWDYTSPTEQRGWLRMKGKDS